MTTDVSSRPAPRGSGTGIDALVRRGVEILDEPLTVDRGRSAEDRRHHRTVNQTMATQRPQLTDRDGVTRHDKGAAGVQFTHDPPAVVAQLSLANRLRHDPTVARSATEPAKGSMPSIRISPE